MKSIFAGCAIICGAILFAFVAAANPQNVSQACGISGIMLRADGSVVVDGWKDYSASRIANPSNPVIESKDMPTAIHLGKNLSPLTPVCFEDATGSHCIKLEVARKVK